MMHAHTEPDLRQVCWRRFLICCFVVICGVRFFLIERYGAPIAWGDDLDGTAWRILAPLNNGTFDLSLLFVAHNGDHVIVATRLWEILWYYLNGREWDPKLVMLAKAPVFAAAMTIFIHLLAGGLRRHRMMAASVLTLLFAFPFNYSNLLWAFQSQFDFFFLAAALGWLALLDGRPILALVCAFIAPFTLGAGPIVAVSFVPFALACYFGGSWPARKTALFCAAAIAIAACGASLPEGAALPRTGTPLEKALTFVKLYAWPFTNLLSAVERLPEDAALIPRRILNFPSAERSLMLWFGEQLDRHAWLASFINFLVAVAMVAPTAVVAVRALRRKLPLSIARGVLCVSVFVGAMLAATAVARVDQSTIGNRFLDHVSLAGFTSIVAAFILAAHQRRWRIPLVLWGLILASGYLATVGATMSQIVNRRRPQISLEILQRYYAGTQENGVWKNNHTALLENNNFSHFIVSNDPTEFMSMLDDPILRPVMPRAVTAPGSTLGPAAAVASVVGKWGLLIAFLAACAGALTVYRSRRPKLAATPVTAPATPA